MNNRRLFFLYQNSTELNLIKFIIDLLPSNYNPPIYIFCVDSFRFDIKSLKALNVNKIIIDEILYSKNFIKEFKKLNSLKKTLNSLQIDENDIFLTQPLFSLNNFIIYKNFLKAKSRIVSYALNSVKIKNNKFFKLNYLMSFKRSLYTLIYSRKVVYYFTIKDLGKKNMYTVFTKTYSNIHIDFGPSWKNEMINSIHDLKFERTKLNLKTKQNSNDILLLIKSHKSNKIFGFSEEIYLDKIREIVKYLKSLSFSIYVKNHPSSSISLENLAKKIDISKNYIINKELNLEDYLKTKSNNYKYVLTEDSSSALTLHFYNINYCTINELLLKGSSILSKIHGLNILKDLNELNKMGSRTFNNEKNYCLNKSLFNDYIQNV